MNKISVISKTPCDPVAPTLKTGVGLAWLANAAPFAASTVHASPTICVPAGIVIVLVITYTPASKKIILQPENCQIIHVRLQHPAGRIHAGQTSFSTFVMAAVSSVTPSPTAPLSRTLTNWLAAYAAYCG